MFPRGFLTASEAEMRTDGVYMFGSERERLQLQERREKDSAVPSSQALEPLTLLSITPVKQQHSTYLCILFLAYSILNILTLCGVVQEGLEPCYLETGSPDFMKSKANI